MLLVAGKATCCLYIYLCTMYHISSNTGNNKLATILLPGVNAALVYTTAHDHPFHVSPPIPLVRFTSRAITPIIFRSLAIYIFLSFNILTYRLCYNGSCRGIPSKAATLQLTLAADGAEHDHVQDGSACHIQGQAHLKGLNRSHLLQTRKTNARPVLISGYWRLGADVKGNDVPSLRCLLVV